MANPMTIEERNFQVKGVEEDGRFVTLEWTTENGERVSGEFSMFMWNRAPEAEYERFHKIASAPPKAILRPRPQVRKRS